MPTATSVMVKSTKTMAETLTSGEMMLRPTFSGRTTSGRNSRSMSRSMSLPAIQTRMTLIPPEVEPAIAPTMKIDSRQTIATAGQSS